LIARAVAARSTSARSGRGPPSARTRTTPPRVGRFVDVTRRRNVDDDATPGARDALARAAARRDRATREVGRCVPTARVADAAIGAVEDIVARVRAVSCARGMIDVLSPRCSDLVALRRRVASPRLRAKC
jgi:hypothetical protein